MASRFPPLLEPYLALPPEASLILLTSVLGASSNWLVLRYLYSYLRGPGSNPEIDSSDGDGETGVVLVSFLRDRAFWRDGAARLGLDLDAMGKAGRFVFVDGLTGLFTPETSEAAGSKDRTLQKPEDLRKELEAALGDLQPSRRILIIDQPDALLAASGDEVTSLSLQNTLLSLRQFVHASILTLAADAPLLQAQATTLEREHAALVTGTAHAAGQVLALRMLDTGTAKDVSGVVRITGNGEREEEGREYLYFVAGDGGVKVFERGA